MLNAIALYDCVADEEGELSFTEGTRFVDVVDSSEEDWLEGRIEGTSQRGLFPSNYVNVITVSSTPTKVKPIPKSSRPEASLSHSVSPPNSNISSSWSVIPNTPTNSTPTADIFISSNNNSSNQSTSKTTRLDAFDSAMQTSPSAKYSDIATALMNKRTLPKPAIASSSPITTTSSTSASFAMTMDTNKLPSSSRAFVLPAFSPAQQQTRTRSFSASSTTSPAPPTALKPSALRQDFRKKAQLDTSWRTKQDDGLSSPTTNTNTSQVPSLNRVTDNKANTVSVAGNDDEDMEEEDGYQLIKPSQLRKRQQQQQQQQQGKESGKLSSTTSTTTTTNLPLSSSVSTSAIPTQKSSTSTKIRLQTLPSSSTTHLAKLPSRPVSNANRLSKSRSSSTTSNSLRQSKNSTSSVISNNNTATITTGSNKNAPIVKPKPPQLNNLPKTSTMTTVERSTSNPPPMQPKTFANDTHRPSKPAVESKPLFPLPATSQFENNTTATKTIPLVGTRGGVALPGLGKKNSAPTLPTRPSATTTITTQSSSGSAIDDIFKDKKHIDENTNLKPSQLLTTQRARSSTNPSFATRPLVDLTNSNGNGSKKLTSTALLDIPIDGAIRSPPPPPPPPVSTTTTTTTTTKSSSSPAIPLVIKQAPPPPPPSRQINHSTNITSITNKKESSGGRTRYDELFDAIQDDGYVDGLTTQVIWSKSRLSDDILAGIWQQCDQQKSGLLDRQRFIYGMRQIDSHLTKNKTPVIS